MIRSSPRTNKKKPDSPSDEADKTGRTVTIPAEDIPIGDGSFASKTLRAFHHDRSDNDASTAATNTNTKRSVTIERNTTETVTQIRCQQPWDTRYTKLVAYLKEHKVWPVYANPQSKSLYTWVQNQRISFRNGKLSPDRKKQLDNLGFAWEGAISGVPFSGRGSQSLSDSGIDGDKDTNHDGQHKNNPVFNSHERCGRKTWDDRYRELVAYLEQHKVWPDRSDPQSKSLNQWLTTQRQSCKRKTLSDDRKNQLDDLGFAWKGAIGSAPFSGRGSQSLRDSGIDGDKDTNHDGQHENNPVFNPHELCGRTLWDRRYRELVIYLEEHKVWPDYSHRKSEPLHAWLTKQRRHFRDKELCNNKKQQLDELGFWWKGHFGGTPYRPNDSQTETSASTNPGGSVQPGQDPQEPTDNVKDNSDNRNRNNNDSTNNDDDGDKNSCNDLDDEESDYYGDEESEYYDDNKSDYNYEEESDYYYDNEEGEQEGVDCENVDHAQNGQDEEGRHHELDRVKHDSDYDSDNPISRSDIFYDHQDDEESDYYYEEESDYYYNNEEGEQEGIDYENVDHAQNGQDEEGRRHEPTKVKHDSDYDSDNPISRTDIFYDHQDDEDDEDEDEDECADAGNQEPHNIEQDPSHLYEPGVTSSGSDAQNDDNPSQHDQDTIVADRIESSSLPLQQGDTIRTTVARLPSGHEEDHQTTPGLSGLESMSLWVANEQIYLRRVSEEELRRLAAASLPNIPTTGGSIDRQGDVGDGDDRKMAATVVGDGIFDDAPEDDKIVTTNSPTAVEHEVRQESDWCGSSSCGSQQEAWDGDDDDDGDDDIDFEV